MACKYDAKDFKKFFKSFGRQLNDYTAGLSMLAKEDALRSIRLRLINTIYFILMVYNLIALSSPLAS